MSSVNVVVGCYTTGHEPLAYYTNTATGNYVVSVDTTEGTLSVSDGPVNAGTNATFAAFDAARNTVYFTNENLANSCVKAFRLEGGKLTALNSQPVDGNHACYLSVARDSSSVLCASYVSGDVHIFPTAEDGSLLPWDPPPTPTAHSI